MSTSIEVDDKTRKISMPSAQIDRIFSPHLLSSAVLVPSFKALSAFIQNLFTVNFTAIPELLPPHPQDTKQSWPGVSKPQSQLLQTKLTGNSKENMQHLTHLE